MAARPWQGIHLGERRDRAELDDTRRLIRLLQMIGLLLHRFPLTTGVDACRAPRMTRRPRHVRSYVVNRSRRGGRLRFLPPARPLAFPPASTRPRPSSRRSAATGGPTNSRCKRWPRRNSNSTRSQHQLSGRGALDGPPRRLPTSKSMPSASHSASSRRWVPSEQKFRGFAGDCCPCASCACAYVQKRLVSDPGCFTVGVSSPNRCPTCGSHVSMFAAGCAICGVALDPRRGHREPFLQRLGSARIPRRRQRAVARVLDSLSRR